MPPKIILISPASSSSSSAAAATAAATATATATNANLNFLKLPIFPRYKRGPSRPRTRWQSTAKKDLQNWLKQKCFEVLMEGWNDSHSLFQIHGSTVKNAPMLTVLPSRRLGNRDQPEVVSQRGSAARTRLT